MKTIYKYHLVPGECSLLVPEDARILHLEEQHGQPWVWMLVDTGQPYERRTFVGCVTGEPLGDTSEYVGSVLLDGGDFVLHFFDVTRSRP